MKSPVEVQRASHVSHDDEVWQLVLAQLTQEGLLPAETATVVRSRHDQIAGAERDKARRSRIIELAGYAGAALMVTGLGAISSQVWGSIDESLQVFVAAALAVVLMVSAGAVAVTTPGGWTSLKAQTEDARRRLVGVLGVAAAGLTTATVTLAVDAFATGSDPMRTWLPLATGLGLLVAAAVAAVAPGVIPTLAVGAFLGQTVLTTLEVTVGLESSAWVVPLAGVVLAVIGVFVLSRVLVPGILVEALSIAVWVIAGGSALAADSAFGQSDTDVTIALWIGRIALVTLVVLGTVLFTRGGEWPWAAGAAVGLAVLIQASFAEALGGAVAMTLAGVVLVITSVVLSRVHRKAEQESSAGPPDG